MKRKIIVLTAVYIIIGLICTGYMAYNTNTYSKILETESHFNYVISDVDMEHNIAYNNSGELKGFLWINTTIKLWNNGSLPIEVYNIQFKVFLNGYSWSNYIGSKGPLLYQLDGNIVLEPGESKTYELPPLEHNISEIIHHPDWQNPTTYPSPLFETFEKGGPWNFLFVDKRARFFYPEFRDEGWARTSNVSVAGEMIYYPLEQPEGGGSDR